MNPVMKDADTLRALSRLVVKQGVALGGLPVAEQALALGLAWAGLPADSAMSEPQVNQALKARLAGAAVCLDTDHVELRRWLVDAGWLQRDGWGREYRRVPAPYVAPQWRALATEIEALDSDSWVAARRGEQQARREERRRAWEAAAAA
jgi:hypothetical protein